MRMNMLLCKGMNRLTIILCWSALVLAGLLGITLSLPLQSLTVALFGLTGLFAFMVRLSGGGRQIEGNGLRMLVILSLFYFVVRAFVSPVWDLGVEDLMLVLSAGLLYILAAYESGAVARIGLAWCIVVLLIIHLISAVMQINGGDGYSLAHYLSSSKRSTPEYITGMYGYYGSFANFAVVSGLLCLSLGVWGRIGSGLKILVFVIGMAALVFAVMSGSRSAMLSLVVGGFVFLVAIYISLKQVRRAFPGRAMVLLITMVVGVLSVSAYGVMWVMKARGSGNIEAAIGFNSGVRIPFWAMAVEQWADHPVVGAGSRSFSYECFRYWSPNLNTGEKNPEFVHNEYLQLMADYGMVGLLLILTLFVWHFIIGSKLIFQLSNMASCDEFRKGSNAMALAIAGVSGMTAMGIHILFDYRTHLLANLLLLICCVVWVHPLTKKVGASRVRSFHQYAQAAVLFFLGISALYMGIYQFRGGWPLLSHRMAKENGAWDPQTIDREKMIAMLENSVDMAPHYRRHLRLGTLYQSEAMMQIGQDQVDLLDQSERQYIKSIERHPDNLIAKINLAAIYAARSKYKAADEVYASASELAKARERWFRMHIAWGRLHLQWADALWRNGKVQEAETHFSRGKELYEQSQSFSRYYYPKNWVPQFSRVLLAYARFLDSQKRYREAEKLYMQCKEEMKWGNLEHETQFGFVYSQHLYEYGKSLWFARKPEEAYLLMKEAKIQMLRYKRLSSGELGHPWYAHMADIEEVIVFLEKAGISGENSQSP